MQDYGHRVRLATHSNFKDFVLTAGLEFYPLGGDPKVLAGCMYLNVSVTFILETHTHTYMYVYVFGPKAYMACSQYSTHNCCN